MVYLALLLLTFLTTLILTPLVRKLALKWGALDQPASRKIHAKPIPLLGGVGIFLSFIIGILVFTKLFQLDSTENRKLIAIILGAFIMTGVGIYDDKRGLHSKAKLTGQLAALLAAGLVLFWAGIEISLFIQNPVSRYLITLLWMVGITNSLNLLDNMNGLACGITVIAACLFFLVALQQSQVLVAGLAICLCGAALGFLPYNFPRASIFMGDGGSLFLGFSLASLAVIGVYLNTSKLNYLPVITPLLVLAVPILDTFTVIVIRLYNRTSIFSADKNHLSHQLLGLGFSTSEAVLMIYLLAVAVGINVLLLTSVSLFQAVIVLLHTAIIFLIFLVLIVIGKKKGDRRID